MKRKTALQRLAFRIAETVHERIDDAERLDRDFELEDMYMVVYAALPLDMEALAAEEEAFDLRFKRLVEHAEKPPSMLSRLRDAVHADKGTPLKVVLEAAIKGLKDRANG